MSTLQMKGMLLAASPPAATGLQQQQQQQHKPGLAREQRSVLLEHASVTMMRIQRMFSRQREAQTTRQSRVHCRTAASRFTAVGQLG
jgi:hypothetical protein